MFCISPNGIAGICLRRGVRLEQVPGPGEVQPSPYMQLLERAEAFGNAMLALRKNGWRPDVVVSHCGFGCSLFAADIFPDARLVNYFEWYYNADYPYPLEAGKAIGQRVQQRLLNQCQLEALTNGHAGYSPTVWQKMQYPAPLRDRIAVVHEGVDTAFFRPREEDDLPDAPQAWPGNRLLLEEAGGHGGMTVEPLPFGCGPLDREQGQELVTFVARGLEPSRGFPLFWRSLPALLENRPSCRVVIVGDDRVAYDAPREDGQGWLAAMRDECPLDESRVLVLPFQGYTAYRELLRQSDLHVYLTVPFVLSWSLMEAMSSGCLILASNTPPVREVVRHGKNGMLASLGVGDGNGDPERLAGIMARSLEKRDELKPLRQGARRTIVEEYNLEDCLARQMTLVRG